MLAPGSIDKIGSYVPLFSINDNKVGFWKNTVPFALKKQSRLLTSCLLRVDQIFIQTPLSASNLTHFNLTIILNQHVKELELGAVLDRLDFRAP